MALSSSASAGDCRCGESGRLLKRVALASAIFQGGNSVALRNCFIRSRRWRVRLCNAAGSTRVGRDSEAQAAAVAQCLFASGERDGIKNASKMRVQSLDFAKCEG